MFNVGDRVRMCLNACAKSNECDTRCASHPVTAAIMTDIMAIMM